MAVTQRYLFINYAIILSILLFGCTKKKSSSRFVEYIQTEKALIGRIGQEQGIEDSVKALREKYGLDPKYVFTELVDEPEVWLDILQDLKDGK